MSEDAYEDFWFDNRESLVLEEIETSRTTDIHHPSDTTRNCYKINSEENDYMDLRNTVI